MTTQSFKVVPKPIYALNPEKIYSIEDVKVVLALLCIQFREDHPAFDIAKEYCDCINPETGELINETVA